MSEDGNHELPPYTPSATSRRGHGEIFLMGFSYRHDQIVTPEEEVNRQRKYTRLKFLFLFIVLLSTVFLLSGVILGLVSLSQNELRMVGMILILAGVVGVVSSAPCCFFYFIKLRSDYSSALRRRSSQSEESEPPSMVSSLYSVWMNRNNIGDSTVALTPFNHDRPSRSGTRRAMPVQTYDPPPDYSVN